MTPNQEPDTSNKTLWGRILLGGIALAIFLLDQVTKYLVLRNLEVNEAWNPIPALRPFVTITHVTNTGAAFGILPDKGTFLVLVAVLVIVGILVYYRYLPADRLLVRASLGLQLGGALGNLLDRLRYGHVVDFVDFKIWPVFNVADSAIVVGVLILAYHLLREGEQPGEIPGPQGQRLEE